MLLAMRLVSRVAFVHHCFVAFVYWNVVQSRFVVNYVHNAIELWFRRQVSFHPGHVIVLKTCENCCTRNAVVG
jgi:hypothetical protein